MKKQLFFIFLVSLSALYKLSAQMQIDHPIQLTGTGANAEITGIKTVANGQDVVNDSAVQRDLLKCAVATGAGSSGNPYAVTLKPAILAGYTTGMVVYFQAPSICAAGPVYANVNGLGNKVIKKNASADLIAGDIAANQVVAIQYDGTNFEMQSQLGNSTSPVITHYVGQLYQGGIIVAVWDSSGYERGLIASLADVATSDLWSNIYTTNGSCGSGPPCDNIGASGESPNIGISNTAAIMTQGATSGAAYDCRHFTGGGYTDWYLPAILELQHCYFVSEIINKVLGANGFALKTYWSSSESTMQLPYYDAYEVLFTDGLLAHTGKQNTEYVRAVRKF